jgi:spectinomycin phosphotransferase
MREPLKLADATILAAVHEHYGIAIRALTFLPIGADTASSAYRIDASDGAAYFLKVRADAWFSVPSLVVPQYLHDRGVPHIVAPLLTMARTLWVSVRDFALSLYPLLDARPAVEVGLSEEHWHALGTTIQQIHASQLPPAVRQIVGRETFVPSRRDVITHVEAVITGAALEDPVQRELAAFWHARQDDICAVVNQADALGEQVRQASLPLVLCHADLHTWNVLLDTAQQIWLVDWDETVFAPKERDLMFVIGGIGRDLVSPRETACFLRGYGDAAIDAKALAYYRYAWAAQDMGAYAEQILFAPDVSATARRDALDSFMGIFAPGNIVAIARAWEGAAA